MEPRCSLCGKTVEELVEEELKSTFYNRKGISIELSNKLCYPYEICGGCEDFIRVIVPKILEAEGIIKFDEEKSKYTLTTE